MDLPRRARSREVALRSDCSPIFDGQDSLVGSIGVLSELAVTGDAYVSTTYLYDRWKARSEDSPTFKVRY